jgi:hypothetical protein
MLCPRVMEVDADEVLFRVLSDDFSTNHRAPRALGITAPHLGDFGTATEVLAGYRFKKS